MSTRRSPRKRKRGGVVASSDDSREQEEAMESEEETIKETPITGDKHKLSRTLGHCSYYATPRHFRSGPGAKTPHQRKSVHQIPTIAYASPSKKKSKRVTFNEQELEINNHDIEKLLKKSWKMCCLSSMHNFFYGKKNKVRSYEARIKAMISSTQPYENLSVTIERTHCFNLDPRRTDAVIITITDTVPGEEIDDEDKIVQLYEAWLFSTQYLQSKKTSKCKWFPLMLYRGRDKIHYIIASWIQSSFSTYIAVRGLSQVDLMWLSAIWCISKCQDPKHNSPDSRIEFKYKIKAPDGFEDLKRLLAKGQSYVKVKFTASDVEYIWKKIRKSSDRITNEDKNSFHGNIEHVISGITYLNTSMMVLDYISTPCLHLTLDGRIRLNCSQTIEAVLNCLIDLIFEKTNNNLIKNLATDEVEVTYNGLDDTQVVDIDDT